MFNIVLEACFRKTLSRCSEKLLYLNDLRLFNESPEAFKGIEARKGALGVNRAENKCYEDKIDGEDDQRLGKR